MIDWIAPADIKTEAIQDLARYGAEAKPAVPALADMLKPNDGNVRNAVMTTLAQLGPEAKAALPALQALRDSDKDQDKNFKKKAEETIKKIEGALILVDSDVSGWIPAERVVAFDRAVPYFTKLVESAPNDPHNYYFRGLHTQGNRTLAY